jgi:hypothetical protein
LIITRFIAHFAPDFRYCVEPLVLDALSDNDKYIALGERLNGKFRVPQCDLFVEQFQVDEEPLPE